MHQWTEWIGRKPNIFCISDVVFAVAIVVLVVDIVAVVVDDVVFVIIVVLLQFYPSGRPLSKAIFYF